MERKTDKKRKIDYALRENYHIIINLGETTRRLRYQEHTNNSGLATTISKCQLAKKKNSYMRGFVFLEKKLLGITGGE